jgi:hypothetical protein
MIKKLTFIYILIWVLVSCKKGDVNRETAPQLSGSFFAQLSVVAQYSKIDLAVGDNSEVYIAGTTKRFIRAGESVDFGGQIVKAGGGDDAFIAKYNSLGSVVWAKILGDAGIETGLAIAVDTDGNIYTALRFKDSTTVEGTKFKARPIVNSSGTPNWYDIILAKFDANGNHVWSKQISGMGVETLESIRIGSNGRVYVSGEFADSIFFDDLSHTLEGSGFYVACYNTDGKVEWAKPYGQGANATLAGAIYVSNMKLLKNGEIVIVGSYEGSKKIGSTVMKTLGDQDAFVAKLDRQGNEIWTKSFGGVYTENVLGLTTDEEDNIYIGGSFGGIYRQGSIVIGSYTFVTPTLAGDAFLVKFNSAGSVMWASQISGTREEYIFDLARHNHRLYVLGYFTDKLYLGDSTLQGPAINAFLAEYSDSGKFAKVDTLGNLAASGRKIFVDKNDSKFILGNFNSYYKFNDLLYPAKSPDDIFLVKF